MLIRAAIVLIALLLPVVAEAASCEATYRTFIATDERSCSLEDYDIYGGKACNKVERKLISLGNSLLRSSCRVDRQEIAERLEVANNRLRALETNPSADDRRRRGDDRYYACYNQLNAQCYSQCMGDQMCVSGCLMQIPPICSR